MAEGICIFWDSVGGIELLLKRFQFLRQVWGEDMQVVVEM